MCMRALFSVALLLAASCAAAGQVELPADLSVHLSAEPDHDLVTGQPITFTLVVTNHGPEAVDNIALESSAFVDEFDLGSAVADCPGLGLIVVDGKSFYYLYMWIFTYLGPLQPQESRLCYITLPVGAHAPEAWTFGFFLPASYVDLNPSNNSSSVTLRRGSPTARPIPALSPRMLLLLMLLIASMGAMANQRRHTGRSFRNNRPRRHL